MSSPPVAASYPAVTLSDRHCTEDAFTELQGAGLISPPPTWACTVVVNDLLNNSNFILTFTVNAKTDPAASLPVRVQLAHWESLRRELTAAKGTLHLNDFIIEYARSIIEDDAANAPPQAAVPDVADDYLVTEDGGP